jgi:5-methyltetrahydrofolate--homocysteine methyltransferase
MVHNAHTFTREGIDMPLLIGGATTSKAHTGVKIEPEYKGAVIHVPDASRVVGVCSKLMNPETREQAVADARAENAKHRERYEQSQRKSARLLPFEEVVDQAPTFDWTSADIPAPAKTGLQVIDSISVEELVPFIDWSPFFWAWELKGVYPKILTHEKYGEEATKLFEDGQRILKELMADKRIQPKAVYGLWPANSRGHTVELYSDAERSEVVTRFHFLRQQKEKQAAGEARYFSCSDFVAPATSGRLDTMGAFAVTCGQEVDELAHEYEARHDDYTAILIKAIGDRLAEAFAEYLHKQVRDQWGFGQDENLSNEDLIKERYRGIRPAAGYPATPDHTEKRILFDLLQAEKNAGISLTENFAMNPAGSVSGLYFAHPEAKYFHVGRIGRDQLEAYAELKGMPVTEMERWLAPNL